MGYDFDIGSGVSSGFGTAMGLKELGWLTTSAGALNPLGWAATGLMGLAGGLKKEKSVDIPWGQVVTLPQYSFTEPRLKTTSDFLKNNLEALGRGEEMPWISNYYPGIQAGMQKQLKQRYEGSGTQQGLYDIAAQAGSISGVGPKAVQANTNKATLDYEAKAEAIDNEIMKTRAQLQSNAATQFPYLASAMPKGPDAQVIGGGGGGNSYAAPSGGMAGAVGGVNDTLYRLAKLNQDQAAQQALIDAITGGSPNSNYDGYGGYADRYQDTISPWNTVNQSNWGQSLMDMDLVDLMTPAGYTPMKVGAVNSPYWQDFWTQEDQFPARFYNAMYQPRSFVTGSPEYLNSQWYKDLTNK